MNINLVTLYLGNCHAIYLVSVDAVDIMRFGNDQKGSDHFKVGHTLSPSPTPPPF